MHFLKRWTLSLATSFDNVMSQVQNHEALIGAALDEMRDAAGKARGQVARVKRDGQRLNERVEALRTEAAAWETRALRSAEADREKAIECLRRKRSCEREVKALEKQANEHERVSENLVRDLHSLEERIAELSRKKNALTAREYQTRAMKSGESVHISLIGEIDDIFDRWEMKLHQCDTLGDPRDSFEEGFEKEEEKQTLEADLAELLRTQNAQGQ